MNAWQLCVVEERAALRIKIRKMVLFIYVEPEQFAMDEYEWTLLRDQLAAMLEYDSSLSVRIQRFVE